MKDMRISLNEMVEVFQFLLAIVVREDLTVKKKKPIVDVIKSMNSTNQIVNVFNHSRKLVERMIETMFRLQEQDGLKLMKAFNILLVNQTAHFSHEIQNTIKIHYYEWMLNNLDRFTNVMDNIARENKIFTTSQNQEQNMKAKTVLFKDSVAINEEILNNTIISMDKNFPSSEYIQKTLQKIVNLFLRLKLDVVKNYVDELYFIDILNLVSRGMSFFSGILMKQRDINLGSSDVISSIVHFIESQRESGSDMVLLLLDFLNNVPSYMTRLKVDAFSYIKTFFEKYPDAMTKHMRRMLQDEFFLNSSKIKFSDVEINKIYYYWISAHKSLIKTSRKSLVEILDIADAFMLIENNINILFEENIYPNYLLNLLHNVGNLCDILRDKMINYATQNNLAMNSSGQQNGPVYNAKIYASYLMMFLKKLMGFLKQSRKSIGVLVSHLRQRHEQAEKSTRVRALEELAMLPREEIISRIEQKGEQLLQDELIMRDTFLSKYYPKTLVQHSFNIELDKNYKLESFLEDSIVKKIGILNDIIVKYVNEYFKIMLQNERDRVIKVTVDNRVVYFLNNLNFNEERLIRKIYSNNLKIFKMLLCNAKYLEYENIYDNIKFSTIDYLILKDCIYVNDTRDGQLVKISADVIVRYRDMYKLFDQSVDKLLLTFREIYAHSPENYISFYSLFIDLFSGSGIIESGAKLSQEMMICARLTNKSFNEVIINRIIRVLQKKKLEYYNIYFKEGIEEFKTFAIKVLKGIYRKIKYRDNAPNNSSTIAEDVMDFKESTFKLVLVIMEKTYHEKDIMVYLHLLRNIFTTVYKIPSFCSYFTDEIISRGVKLVNFFTSLFNSNYQEFKIIAVELFVFSPFDIKKILKTELKRTNDAIRFFDLVEFALDLPDNPIIVRTLNILENILGHLDKSEMRVVLNNRIDSIFRKWSNLLKNKENRFFIFKKNPPPDSQKLKLTVKIIGKYAELLNMSRDLTNFDVKDDIEECNQIHFNFFDEQGNVILNGFDITHFIEILYKELKELKQRPWFNHFYSISISFMSLFTNKHKKGLEILYVFLLNLIRKLDFARRSQSQNRIEIENSSLTSEECGKLYEKTFECFFSVLFFIYPFKITEVPSNYQEMESFTNYINEAVTAEPAIRGLFLRLFMRNLLLSLELSNEDIDWTIFNLAKNFIGECISSNDGSQHYIEIFMAELISLLTKGNIYSINAALYIFKYLILDNWNSNETLRNYVFSERISLIQSLMFSFKFVDKKFSLKINENFKTCFERFFELIWEVSPSDPKFLELLADLRNFEDYDLFNLVVGFAKKNGITSIFANITDVICKQINSYLKTIKNYEEDRSTLWTFGFQQHIKLLLCKLIYAFDHNLYKEAISELKDEFVIVVQFINTLKDEVMSFDRRERDYRGSTVVLGIREAANGEEGSQQFIDNPDVYYTNYDLKIHVDKYDYIIKEFSIIIEKCAELVSKIFTRNATEIAENANASSDQQSKIAEYQKMKENCFNKMLEICLRIEKRNLKAILPFLPFLYQDARVNRSEPIANFKILLKFFQKNEISENNLHIISKLVKNYPKLINFEGLAN